MNCSRHSSIKTSRGDAQGGNFAVLQSKAVAKRHWAARKRSADLCNGDCLAALGLNARHRCLERMVFGDSPVYPRPDGITTILVAFISNNSVCREQVQESISLSRVLRLEITEDGSGQVAAALAEGFGKCG